MPVIMKPIVPVVMGRARIVRPLNGNGPSASSGVSGKITGYSLVNPDMKVMDGALSGDGKGRKVMKMRGNAKMITTVPFSSNLGLQI